MKSTNPQFSSPVIAIPAEMRKERKLTKAEEMYLNCQSVSIMSYHSDLCNFNSVKDWLEGYFSRFLNDEHQEETTDLVDTLAMSGIKVKGISFTALAAFAHMQAAEYVSCHKGEGLYETFRWNFTTMLKRIGTKRVTFHKESRGSGYYQVYLVTTVVKRFQ